MSENLSRLDERNRKNIETASRRNSLNEVFSFFLECPRVSIPDISIPNQKTITNSINEWLEELLRSSGNMEIMAERSLDVIGKGDEDLRMREMTFEEGASLKRYKDITKMVMRSKRHLTVSTSCLTFHFPFSQKKIFFVLRSVLLLNDVAQFFYLPLPSTSPLFYSKKKVLKNLHRCFRKLGSWWKKI